MKRRSPFLWSMCTVLVLTCCLSVVADEVHLVNGDRITGEVKNMEKGTLLLMIAYAGEVKVNWADVSCLTTSRSHKFVLNDGQVLFGQAICSTAGTVKIVGDIVGESLPIPVSNVAAINPSPPAPAVKYTGSLAAGYSQTDGNTETIAANASARFVARSKRQRFTLKGKFNYGETDRVMTSRNAAGSLKYDFFVTKRFYAYTHSLFERDDFADLRLRSTLGAGAGYQVIDTERASFSLEAGPSYLNNDFETASDENYVAGRWGVDFSLKIIPDRMRVFHSHEGYYSFDDQSVYITSETGLRLTIVDNFFAHAGVDYAYDSSPVEGSERYDVTYKFGLGYEFEL
ncbi:MAG TPA: DUF481 domain-containing protein [bacterium]|nr:DUF481 domain-containing protein [bacterium]